jgi:putative phosphoesterase
MVETRHTLPALQVVGVLGDTHSSPRRTERVLGHVMAFFRRAGVDLILHAGDVGDPALLDDLAAVASVVAVRGNADPLQLIESLPDRVRIDIGGKALLLMHGHHGKTALTAAKAAAGADLDLIVFGHSHKPWLSKEGETILFNPGSPTERRWNPHFGIGLIRVRDDEIEPELILFDDPRQLDGMSP